MAWPTTTGMLLPQYHAQLHQNRFTLLSNVWSWPSRKKIKESEKQGCDTTVDDPGSWCWLNYSCYGHLMLNYWWTPDDAGIYLKMTLMMVQNPHLNQGNLLWWKTTPDTLLKLSTFLIIVLHQLNQCTLLPLTPDGKEWKTYIGDVKPCTTADLIESCWICLYYLFIINLLNLLNVLQSEAWNVTI